MSRNPALDAQEHATEPGAIQGCRDEHVIATRPVSRPGRPVWPGAVTAWIGLALLASSLGGFASGGTRWSGDPPQPAPAVARSSAEREPEPKPAERRPAPEPQEAAYLRKAGSAIERLRAKRAAARRRLRRARLPAGQAAAADALSAAYRKARKAIPPPPTLALADARLSELLRDSERAYRRLAMAASRGNRLAWRVARSDALRYERQLTRALTTLPARASAGP